MGVFWSDADSAEEVAVRSIHSNSRRTFLFGLVVTGLLVMAVIGMSGTSRWAVLGPFVLAAVASVYGTKTFLAARRYYKRKSNELGVVDPLTRLPNRKGLMVALENLDVGPSVTGRHVRLIDIDLLNLNRVNYEFGQMVGDAVLQDLGELLSRETPEDCVVGRLGGDEFLVVVPNASQEEAEQLAGALEKSIGDYELNVGDRGAVGEIKAQISVADYLPERASLHETVISAKEASAHGHIAGESSESAVGYHVPRVTLGAFAARRWQSLSAADQEAFKLWKREPGNQVDERMVGDLLRLLEEKAEVNWADFVTAVPSPNGVRGRPYAARLLAETLAKRLGIPYRDVMRVDASGPESRTVQPAVDAVIDKGEGVLLVSDVISSGIVERRCVKTLSAAGAHVQVAAWVAY